MDGPGVVSFSTFCLRRWNIGELKLTDDPLSIFEVLLENNTVI